MVRVQDSVPGVMLATATDPDTERAKDIFVARFGSFIIATDEEPAGPYGDTVAEIVRQLRADLRVLSVTEPEVEEYWCSSGDLYPSPTHEHGILTGHDAMHWLRFNDLVAFTVEVPEKNRRRLSQDDVVPTGYEVYWDGVFVLVMWKAPRDEMLGMSGGLVVEEILSEALDRAGLTLYVQGCTPDCDHRFVHTMIRLLPGPKGQDDVEYVASGNSVEVNALMPDVEEEDFGETLSLDLRISAGAFAKVKNVGRRILDVEEIARRNLDRLLDVNLYRAEIPVLGWKQRVRRRWEMRSWRRESNRFIAQLWLALSIIELLRRRWMSDRQRFEDDVAERGLNVLYARDHADDASQIESLGLDLMRSAVEDAAERLDRRALVTVTGVAAIAGGLAGAVFGALAGGIF